MNRFKSDRSLLIGLFWVPAKYSQKVYEQIRNGGRMRIAQIYEVRDHELSPPTFFEMNEFIYPFHEIVVTYGTPNYKEINPTTFNMVTFPFLFGVMFGDIGHGLILFLFAAYLCLNKENVLKNSPSLSLLVRIRYLLLLMGFFATYAGFIYNDMMAMPLDLFGTCYTTNPLNTKEAILKEKNCVYPFGFDPKWYVAHNELSFFNSFKMKFAVIIGVMQMTLGVIMKGMNAVHHRSTIDFVFEFLPQLVFLLSLFGLMDIMIILKWLTDWSGREGQAPSVITQMINIALKGGEINGTPLLGSAEDQMFLTNMLMLNCLVCVPLMLYIKPWYLHR